MQIVIAGGTGFVGKALCGELLSRNHQLTVLSRNEQSARVVLPAQIEIKQWNPEAERTAVLPEGIDAIVNLAGESIANGRWTDERKDRIHTSRVRATIGLVEGMSALSQKPAVLVNASAIGYYGDRGDEELPEEAPPGSGFLPNVVRDWERSARRAEALGMRVALMRIGVVFGREEGALPRMTMPFKFFLGGPVGDGKQWLSWVHLQDVVGMIVWAVENDAVSGPINTVSPQPLTNAELSKEFGRAMGRPSWLPVPELALKLMLGEMAESLLLGSQRVLPTRALALGYQFRYPTIQAAVREALG